MISNFATCTLKLHLSWLWFDSYQPINLKLRYSKFCVSSGFVNISVLCSSVSIVINLIVLFLTWSLKWWYLMAMCFALGLYFSSLVSSKVLLLSSNTDECVTGYCTFSFKMFDNSDKIPFRGTNSLILWLQVIYSASVVDSEIFIYILLTHSMRQLT